MPCRSCNTINNLSLPLTPYLVFVLFLISYNSNSQIKIEGVVKDTSNVSVPFISVIMSSSSHSDNGNILAFTTANSNGYYTLNLNNQNSLDSVYVTFRHLSYDVKSIKVKAKSQVLNPRLTLKNNRLEDVLISTKKNIVIKEDTITYNVKGLKKIKDYTIEEVINRIPGVTIAENGQIKYKNKSISHLYINGVDLLEGRYNIATRGIPAEAVESIEVLQRHNHALIDKKRTPSNKVAFNLNIKDNKNIIFGSLKSDAGLPLLTANIDVTPIYIKNKVQNISSIKANNIGESLESNGTNLTNDNIDFNFLKLDKLDVLNAPNILGEGLTQKFWLDNESLSITNDILVKQKKDFLFKAGVSYNSDDSSIERLSNSIFFFGNDSTEVNQATNNNLKNDNYYIGLSQEVNRANLYFKNKLTLNAYKSRGESFVTQNTLPINYRYDDSRFWISNTLNLKFTIADKILNNALLVEYFNNQENINIFPSVFEDKIPSDFNSEQTNQRVKSEQLNLSAFSQYNIKLGETTLGLTQKISYKAENFGSDLSQQNNEEQTAMNFPFSSDFNLKTFETNSLLKSHYQWKSFKFNLQTELRYLNLSQVESQDINLNNNFIFLQPNFSIHYKVNSKWSFLTDISETTTISNFSELFPGLIVTDFSNLIRNPNDINVTKILSGNLFLKYSNVLRGFFFNNNTSVNHLQSDFTILNTINSSGLIEANFIEQPNLTRTLSNTTSITKTFFRLINTELSYRYSYSLTEQFFNAISQSNINIFHNAAIELNLDNNTWYGITYAGNINYGISRVDEFETTNLFLKHNLELNFYTTAKTRFNLEFESVSSSLSDSDTVNNNSLFNIAFFYKPKKKLFLKASLFNVFNETFFNSIFNNSNVISQTQFSLRPRQFTIGINYSL